LAASPKEAVGYLKEHLPPAPPLDAARVEALLTQLESDKFKERMQASNELVQLGERGVPGLEKALASQPPLEGEKRLYALIDRLAGPKLTGEQVRAVRAVEVLERIGTPQAVELLQALAGGAPGALTTTNSQTALQRLRK